MPAPITRALLSVQGGHAQAGARAAVDVLEELAVDRQHRDLVVEPQPGGRAQRGQVPHRRSEDREVRRVRLRPAFQGVEAAPPAHAVAAFAPLDGDVAVAETAHRRALVAQEVHARPQHRLDVLEVHAALVAVGVGPVLARADQAEARGRPDAHAARLLLGRGRPEAEHRVGLRERDPVAHPAPIRVLDDLAGHALGQHGDPFRAAERGEQRLVLLHPRADDLGPAARGRRARRRRARSPGGRPTSGRTCPGRPSRPR